MKSERKIGIVMAVTNDLVTDRRVCRHSAALNAAGFSVQLVGRSSESSFHSQDRTLLHVRSRRGWRFYAEYNVRLFFHLLFSKAGIFWANDTDTLLACYLAARLRGRRLMMDAHELFPEVPELMGRERVKRFWSMIEHHIMPKCDALITVCHSIADYYYRLYGVNMTVVRNLPDNLTYHMVTIPSDHQAANPPTLLYQGAVNKGRGVDWAIDALEFLPECRLLVVGVGDELDAMRNYAASKSWSGRIEFLGRLEPSRLVELTPQASVGLIMLDDLGLSYHYALPNRIGDFVQAAVPMVVSDLPEMASVVRRFNIGAVIQAPGAKALAEAVRYVLVEWQPLSTTERNERFVEARADMDWNIEKEKLIKLCYTTFC